MFELLEKLRQKPESTKQKVAFLTAFSFAGLIFVIWLSVIYPDWRQVEKKEAAASKNEPGPLAGFSNNFSDGFQNLKKQFTELKNSAASYVGEVQISNSTTTNKEK